VPALTALWQVLFWGEEFAPTLASILLLQSRNGSNGYINQEDAWRKICDVLEREKIPFSRIDEFIGVYGLEEQEMSLEFIEF
jgi:hypothetical protein